MTNAKNVYALMLALVIVLSGCFGATSDESDAQDSESNDREQNDDSEGMDREDVDREDEDRQARTWYSSAGIYNTYWNDGQYSGYYSVDGDVLLENGTPINGSHDDDDDYNYRQISNNGQRCLDFGPYYDSSTGELLGERCNEWDYPESASDWNVTDCTDNGGEIIWHADAEENDYYYRHAPTCKMTFATINSTAGEALLIYEWYGFSIASTCDGVSVSTSSSYLSGKEYVIAPGTALECSHEIYRTLSYTSNQDYFESQSIWSIVYAIQDTTVV